MDAEIAELQRLLAAAQAEDVSRRLNDRNCIELVTKLINLGMITVIRTNGGEYLTPKALEQEIKDEILTHGGRINIVELQPAINVGINHIETKIDEMLKKDGGLYLVNGELVTNYYLDNVAEEVNELLQDRGQLSLSDLTRHFELPSDFVSNAIEKRLCAKGGRLRSGSRSNISDDTNTIIQGQFRNGVLFTSAYVEREIARVRGMLSAVTRPTALNQLITMYKFDQALFHTVVKDLASSSFLCGRIRGSKDPVFVPTVFLRNQSLAIDAFFKENGFIEYKMLEKLQVSDPRSFMERKYGIYVNHNDNTNKNKKNKKSSQIVMTPANDGSLNQNLSLETCFVGEGLVKNVDTHVAEVVASGEWQDLQSLVPPCLARSDISVLLDVCPSLGDSVLLLDRYVVSSKYLTKIKSRLREHLQVAIKESLLRSPKVTPTNNNKDNIKDNMNSNTDKNSRNKKGGACRGELSFDLSSSEDDWSDDDGGKGNKKGKKNSRRGINKKKKGNDQIQIASSVTPIVFSLNTKECIELFRRWYPDLCGDGSKLVEAITEILFPSIQSMVESIRKDIFEGDSLKRRQVQATFEKEFDECYTNIQLFGKGITATRLSKASNDSGKEATANILEKTLLREFGGNLLNLLIKNLAFYNDLEISNPDVLNGAGRLKIINGLPKDVQAPLLQLLDVIATGSINDLLDTIDATAEVCQVLPRRFDKKKEKVLLQQFKETTTLSLKNELSPPTAFQLSIVLLFVRTHHAALFCPPKSIPNVFEILKSSEMLSPSAVATLNNYHSLVTRLLLQQHDDDPSINIDLQKELNNLVACATGKESLQSFVNNE